MAIEIGGKMYVTVAERLQAVHAENDRFEDFVVTPPLAGLGASVDLIQRIVKDDEDTCILLRETLKRTHGGNRKSEQSKEEIKSNNVTLDRGNSESYALEILQNKRPDGRPEGKPKQTVYNIHNIERPSGTSETRALRMLRDHREGEGRSAGLRRSG